MKDRLISLILIIFIGVLVSSGQNATLWGPGEDYEIGYLHSGELKVNSTVLSEFYKQPSTEFRIQNITNDGYDYYYLGYGNTHQIGQIRIRSFSIAGLSTFEVPTGGMPVALPLSYQDSEDWITKFDTQINVLSFQANSSISNILSAKSTLTNEMLELKFKLEFNGNLSLSEQFFDLPVTNPEMYENNFVNGTFFSELFYKRTTGVLFKFNLTIISDDYLDENNSTMGNFFSSQVLDFVAIIPPTSIIDNITTNLKFSFFYIGIFLIPIFRKTNKS